LVVRRLANDVPGHRKVGGRHAEVLEAEPKEDGDGV
jgi:hypothetical protein